MADYPGGNDLGLEDRVGAQFSLVWGRDERGELNAEIAIKDDLARFEGTWACVNLDLDQLREIAAFILAGASVARGEARDELRRMLEASAVAEEAA